MGLLAGAFFAPAPALAHASLTTSDPGNGVVVPDAPDRVTLTFTESVQVLSGRTQVLAPDGSAAHQGDPIADGATITISLRPGGGRGTYLVSYRVLSADSHPISGSITYSVGETSGTPTAASDDVDPALRILIPVVKYLGYLGLVLVIGPVLLLTLLWPHRLGRRGPGRLVWSGLGLVGVSTLLALWLQVPYAFGTALFDVRLGDLRDVLGSTFGAVMLVRLGVLCACAFLLRPLLRGSGGDSRTDLALLGVLGLAAAATWPLTGHPTASPVAGVSVVVDTIHLGAASVWVGGLVVLAGFLLPRATPGELGAILPIWSRWAAAAVSALIVAGVIQALIEVPSLGALVGSTYGRVLLVKLGLVALVLIVASFSRRMVERRAAETEPRGLRRIVVVEIAVTAVVIAVTSALVQIPPPRTSLAAEAGPANTTVTKTVSNATTTLRVDVLPAAVGNNSIHLYAYTPVNQPLTVVEWRGTVELGSAGIEPIEIPLLRITDFHAIGDVALPVAGEWTVKVTVRVSDIDQSTLTTTVQVS
uniref:copper resistance CopC/CopD family protein n=1 Tax=Paractinoplanes polyasparticus TaxID=2856853 RepID=UPI0027E1C41F|nr:copper resistance protein CopC [Actinoplanes polyasparticus]